MLMFPFSSAASNVTHSDSYSSSINYSSRDSTSGLFEPNTFMNDSNSSLKTSRFILNVLIISCSEGAMVLVKKMIWNACNWTVRDWR